MRERLKTIRKLKKLTQRQFAERIGVSRDVIASWEIGRVQPSEALIRLICRDCGVRYAWLKDGEGEMTECRENTDAEKLRCILEGDDSFMKSFLFGLVDLPKEAWEQMEAFVETLRNGPGKG